VGVDYSTTAPPHNYAKYYLTGNYMTGSTVNTASNWKGVSMKSGLMSDTVLSKVLVPFNLPALASETSASQAYLDVLAGAGAILPERDTLDQRIVNDVKNNTGKIIDVQGGFPHGTAYALTVNAWPTLVSTTAPVDTDRDGMPDTYETKNGLNPNSAADRNTRNSIGYTALEVYINSILANGTIPTGIFDSKKDKSGLLIYPNPSSAQLTLIHPAASTGAMVKIVGIDGKTVLEKKISKGSQTDEIEIASLKPGNYILTFNNSLKEESLKFIKQ
jgi:hypothetical protein